MRRHNGVKRLFQPRIVGVQRESRHAGLLPHLNDSLDAIAKKYGVTPSWVLASFVAEALGDSEQPDFRVAKKAKEQS